jgi:glucose/arabinose dehydrogenase
MIRLLLAAAGALTSVACSAQTQTAGATPNAAPPFAVETIGRFASPFALAFLPDGRLLVSEKAGRIKLRAANGQVTDVTGVPAVAAGGQGGLLDVAPAPDFAKSRLIYWSYSEPREDGSSLALARGRLTEAGGSAKLEGVEVIWRAGSDGAGGQFGAAIAFDPDGRSLYLASGERQRFTPAQDPDQALGKILHLTLDGAPWPGNPGFGTVGKKWIVVTDPPADSEKAKTAPGRRVPARRPNTTPAETWSTGHRNPYGLAFDDAGRLWEAEMGPRGGDEVNLIRKGRNYGWPLASNGDNYNGVPIPDHRKGDGFEAPKVWWNPSISPGGIAVYRGAMFKEWKGSLLVAGLGSAALFRLTIAGDTAAKADQWNMGTRIRDVAQAPDGSVWLIGDGSNAPLLRLTAK